MARTIQMDTWVIEIFMLKIGIEQEFVFADHAGRYLDADNTPYSVFGGIVEQLPVHAGDDAFLECKSLEQFPRRCYVEGFERHDSDGRVIDTVPKGLEIRTLPHSSVKSLVSEFEDSYAEVMHLATQSGIEPVLTSRHPFKSSLALDHLLSESEYSVRTSERLELAKRSMLTHGLHINISMDEWPMAQMERLVEKLNFYTPFLVPWSFSSPFNEGGLFDGLCARNYSRAGSRSMAAPEQRKGGLVVEFRGFDAIGSGRLMTALVRLFRGFVLDESLPGSSTSQNAGLLKCSAVSGFSDPEINRQGRAILHASRAAFREDKDSFELLETMLHENDSFSARMQRCYSETGSIMESISKKYDF